MRDHDEQDPLGFTPHPDDPFPRPLPGLLPRPQPLPWPLPPDWWRCWRLGPVSGRYEGLRTGPVAGGRSLDLRVDVDPRYANSPVMDRASGDFYAVYSIGLPGRPPISWRVYQESWIVDAPTVQWSRCSVEITGNVRFWKGAHPLTTVRIVIPWGTFQPAGPAAVTFTEGGTASSYTCARRSDCFRSLTLEVDVCQSVNAEPIPPSYDTDSHATRPPDLPRRTLTIEESYREAGVCVTIRPERTIVDDSDPSFATWSPAELHDALETHFSQYAGGWPKWEMWGLLAGSYEVSAVAGVMFDAAAMYGGAGEPPERQGFAVFRNHSWFNNLVAGAPANQAQAAAMRQYLYTWIHEAGHAFNLLHSWDKGRPDSLSWMNYPQNVANFWDNFRFRFDDEELIHMRHGDRAAVIMGGDPWASGGHLESPDLAAAQLEGSPPVELLLRSKGYFEFLEPIVVEFRLRNLSEDLPMNLDTRLRPESGGVAIFVQRPDGRVVQHAPVLCLVGTAQMQTLVPAKTARAGEDRYSEAVFLGYGKYGFAFDQPGEYRVRAFYQGSREMLIPSNLLRIRVGRPLTRDEDRLAQDFFSYQVGMSLYLDGSRSPHLSRGYELLQEVADRYKETAAGASAALTLARGLARPFFRVEKELSWTGLRLTHRADPEKALELSAAAMALYRAEKSMAANLPYHDVVRHRAGCLKALGRSSDARKEVATLRTDLAKRGVNQVVLADIEAFEKEL